MIEHVFKIRGMDCAEEVGVLKRELGPMYGEENLGFDLINGKLIVRSQSNEDTQTQIVELIRATGMKAIPWADHASSKNADESFWTAYGRSTTTVLSGLTLAAGFAIHANQHGVLDALVGGESESHSFPLSAIILYAIAIIAGGWFIFPKALFAVRRLRPDMNLLMTVAVIGAALISEWFEAATVAFLFAVALLLESWSVGRARRAIGALMDLSPLLARYIGPNDGDIEEKPVAEVPIGVTVLVRPGEKIPLDGVITQGSTSVNQAPITGESAPVPKNPGDAVFAGTINQDGAVEFQVTKAAKDTTLARIIRMVEEAQLRRAPSEQWVEKFARYYTPSMMLLAAGIAIIPPLVFGGSWYEWFYQALVILVIACPCALVISTPVAIVAGLSAAARAGVLVKGGVYLELPAKLRAVALDKTGTLTMGHPVVDRIVALNGHTEAEVLERAAALEASSEHPLARAILRKAEEHGVSIKPVKGFQAIKGKGAEAELDGQNFWIGSHNFVHEKSAESSESHQIALEMEDAGHSVVAVGNDDHICGYMSIGDAIRPEASALVQSLKDAGIEHVVMLTGDNKGTAEAIASKTGIDEYQAELLPEDKVDAVRSLVSRYGYVAMVGDGVNDAPAMAEASLGIAMGTMGTDVAIETADIALMTDDLNRLPWLIRHARGTLRIIKQNIYFALGLKIVFILLAFGGIATLWMAIAADMGASLLVIFNGLRLLRADRSLT